MTDGKKDWADIALQNLLLFFLAVSWIPVIIVFLFESENGITLNFLNKFSEIGWISDALKLNFYPYLRLSVDSNPGSKLVCLVSFLGGLGAGASFLIVLFFACGPIDRLIAARKRTGQRLSLSACATFAIIGLVGSVWALSGKASFVLPANKDVAVVLLCFTSCPMVFIFTLSGLIATVRVNRTER